MEEEAKWTIINDMSPQQFTFLGVQYDLDANTKTAGEKSWEKLHLIMRCLFPEGMMNPATTPRQLAMLIGTLSYVKRNVEIRHKYLNLHRNLSELAYVLWVYPQAWDIALAPITFMFEDTSNKRIPSRAHQTPDYITHATIVTDHSPIVSAAKSHQPRSYNYFKLLEWLEKQTVLNRTWAAL